MEVHPKLAKGNVLSLEMTVASPEMVGEKELRTNRSNETTQNPTKTPVDFAKVLYIPSRMKQNGMDLCPGN